jgi:hypothetical protein
MGGDGSLASEQVCFKTGVRVPVDEGYLAGKAQSPELARSHLEELPLKRSLALHTLQGQY